MKQIGRIYRWIVVRFLFVWQNILLNFMDRDQVQSHQLGSELIVTLTSYSPRFESLHFVIKSLLLQSVKPDRVVLWIAREEQSLLPDSLLKLESQGLEIRYTEDIRSFKKIIPAIEAFPDAAFIIFDDDLYYPRNTIERLLSTADHYPSCVVAGRVHQVVCDDQGAVLPYKRWKWDSVLVESDDHFFTGCGGVFFPSNCFPSEVLNKQKFLTLTPFADDIWLNWMLKINRVPVIGLSNRFVFWDVPQKNKVSLHSQNVSQSGNDKQIEQMVSEYGQQYCKEKQNEER